MDSGFQCGSFQLIIPVGLRSFALDPPVLEMDKTNGKEATILRRRCFCPPETFVLAVDHLYRQHQLGYQSNLLLDTDKQVAICQICLLEPEYFESVILWACGQYDFIRYSASGGWGNHLVLTRQPVLADFMQ